MEDREKVIKGFELFVKEFELFIKEIHPVCTGEGVELDMFRNVLAMLKEQGQIVRCKDCKHGEKWNAVYACGKPRGFGTTHKPDWFCADGERRD